MENLLNGLKLVQGEIKTKVISEDFGLELNGTFTMERGNFKVDLSYYGRLVPSVIENFIIIDDYEIQDQTNIMVGDLPIDNLTQLKTKLIESGLSTLANSIGFSDKEENDAMLNVVENHKDFKKMYGKNAKLWVLLSKDEQMLANLKHVCNKFDTCGVYLKNIVVEHYDFELGNDENGNQLVGEVPFEDFKSKLDELTK